MQKGKRAYFKTIIIFCRLPSPVKTCVVTSSPESTRLSRLSPNKPMNRYLKGAVIIDVGMFAYSYRWEEETLYYPEYDALHRRIEDAGLEFEDKSGVPMLVVIQTSLKVYGSIFAAFFIAHLIGRRFYPQAYNVLDSVKELRTPLSRNHYGTLSWIWGVFRPSDDELFDHCGMDAVVLIRTIRFGINIALVSLSCSLARSCSICLR